MTPTPAQKIPSAVAVDPSSLPRSYRETWCGTPQGISHIPERNRAPKAGLPPKKDKAVRAHRRSVCGEMHSGFVALRQALPTNIKAHFPQRFKIWSKARADIDRIVIIWSECLLAYGGLFLFAGQHHHGRRDVRAGAGVSRFRDLRGSWALDFGELKTHAERIFGDLLRRDAVSGAKPRWSSRRRSE